MADNAQTKLDALTGKYTEGFEQFSQSKSGNVILDFIMFKKNLVPYTLQILYVLGVVGIWLVAILGILGQGPVGEMCSSMVEKKNGEMASSFNFFKALGISIALIVFAPFVLHYALEIVKFLWGFVIYFYKKVLVPLWETVVLRFFVGTLPKTLPALLERCKKVLDIIIERIGPQLDAMIDSGIAIAMTIAATLKGIVWLPKKICQRLSRWANKPLNGGK